MDVDSETFERRSFEEWYSADRMPCEADWFTRDDAYPDLYASEDVQSAWRAWASRAGVNLETQTTPAHLSHPDELLPVMVDDGEVRAQFGCDLSTGIYVTLRDYSLGDSMSFVFTPYDAVMAGTALLR